MKRTRGFTLIEVLTVIGVIAILASMLFLGAKYMSNSTKKNSTRTMLLNLKAMVTERETAVGATKAKTDIDVLVGGISPPPVLSVAGLNVSSGTTMRYPSVTSPIVQATENVMTYLLAIPSNKTVVANLPQQQFLEKPDPMAAVYPAPILLDGYGNPMIACPSSGLIGVKINDGPANTAANPIVAGDGKPFFASAGPDGDFTTGDDNVYSFDN